MGCPPSDQGSEHSDRQKHKIANNCSESVLRHHCWKTLNWSTQRASNTLTVHLIPVILRTRSSHRYRTIGIATCFLFESIDYPSHLQPRPRKQQNTFPTHLLQRRQMCRYRAQDMSGLGEKPTSWWKPRSAPRHRRSSMGKKRQRK